MSPFGEYKDFADCVAKNGDKDDPKAYCGTIKLATEGKSLGGFLRSALKAIADLVTLGGEKDAIEGVMPDSAIFSIQKDADGRWRWVAVPTNNFRDRDNPAQIIEAAAHKEFVEFCDKTGEFPVLELWHTPGTEFGKADMVDFDHGFLIVSGVIDAGKEALAERLAAEPNLAMSHGFTYNFSDRQKQIIGRYRMREASVLPSEWAANPWTAIEIVGKENKAMQQQKKSFLARLLGQETADALDKGLAQRQQSLAAAGVESKEAKPAEAEAEAAAEKTAVVNVAAPTAEQIAEAVKAVVIESEVFKAFGDAVDKLTADLEAMGERVKAVETENATLKQKIGQKQADLVKEALLARADASRPSASKENIVKAGDPLATAAPKPGDKFMSSLAGALKQPR